MREIRFSQIDKINNLIKKTSLVVKFIMININNFQWLLMSIFFIFGTNTPLVIFIRGRLQMTIKISKEEELLKKRQAHTLPTDLQETHRKHGYFDGRFFYSSDRATYTFLYKHQVIILHFDVGKKHLYFNGHKITALDVHADLPEFLEQFKKCLMQNPQTKELLHQFDCVLAQLYEII